MGKLLLDLKQPAKEEPSDCENLKLNFSLPSGNYYLHGVARTLGNGKFMFHPGDRIVRLQRRRHFRANIPSEFDLTFCVTAINLEIKPVDLRVFDISGSGISFLIRDTPSRLQFKIGDVIHGQIKEDGKRILTLTCHVRHCLPGPEGFEKVGLEFLGLDRKDEQRLIVLSLRVYRHGSPNSFQDEA